jgi:competence protein ComFC
LPRACALCGNALPLQPRVSPLRRLRGRPAAPAGIGGPEGPTLPGAPGNAANCERCGKALISERTLCLRCRASDYHFDGAYPLYAYRGPAKELIVEYKLHNRRSLAVFWAARGRRALRERFPDALLVPVPPRPGKLRRKGWDQVEDIARILEKRHGIAVRRILTRRGGALEQKKLDFGARAANMRACMRVRGRVYPSSRYLVLDDVFTTGATLSACALALKNAGASRVDALVLAAD